MAIIIVYDRNGVKRLHVESSADESIGTVKSRLCREDPDSLCITFNGKLLSNSTPINVLGKRIVLQLENDIEFTRIDEEADHPCTFAEDSDQADALLKRVVTESMPGQSSADGVLERPDAASEQPPAEACAGAQAKHLAALLDAQPRRRVIINGKASEVDTSDTFILNDKVYYITKRRRRINMKYIKELVSEYATRNMLLQLAFFLFLAYTKNIFVLAMVLFINALRIIEKMCAKKCIGKQLKNHVARTIFMFMASLFFMDSSSFEIC